MKVDSHTSFHQLCDFAAQAGNDEIRGRDNGDGTTTLYSSAKASGAGFKECFRLLDGRRQAAREVVDLVLQRVGSFRAEDTSTA